MTETPAPTSRRVPAAFDPQWGGHGGVYGGKVIAALGAAARQAPGVEGYDLLSLGVEFRGAVADGEAEIEATTHHLGRASASVSVVLRQGHERARAQAKLGRVRGGVLPWAPAFPADVPRPEEVPVFEPAYWQRLAHCRLLELRLVEHAVVAGARTTRLWLRLRGSGPRSRRSTTPAGWPAWPTRCRRRCSSPTGRRSSCPPSTSRCTCAPGW